MNRLTHSWAMVAPKGCMALSGGFSFISPSSSLAVRAMRGSSAAPSIVGWDGVGRLPLEQWTGHRVEAEQDRQEAGARSGQAHDHPGALDPLWVTSGCSVAHRCSSMRFVSADVSIRVTRKRPKVVSSASSWHACRYSSSGST